jgi:hypothetical protein
MATDDAAVHMLLEFSGYALDKDDARKLLKISNNNVETAAQTFFDTDAAKLKQLLADSTPRWDETAFGSGRYGQDETSAAIPSTWGHGHSTAEETD